MKKEIYCGPVSGPHAGMAFFFGSFWGKFFKFILFILTGIYTILAVMVFTFYIFKSHSFHIELFVIPVIISIFWYFYYDEPIWKYMDDENKDKKTEVLNLKSDPNYNRPIWP